MTDEHPVKPLVRRLSALIEERETVRTRERALTDEIKEVRLAIKGADSRPRTKSGQLSHATGKAAALRAAAKARKVQVLAWREEGRTFTEIASLLGVSYGRARDLFLDADWQRKRNRL